MGNWRALEAHEKYEIVREPCPDDDYQSQPTRTVHRGPLTREEEDEVVCWITQRIRCVALIPTGRAPTELEMIVAAAMMQCLIWIIDNPEPHDMDGAALVDTTTLAAMLDIILITPSKGLVYVRKVAHELATRLMITEVARELFWATEVCIEAPGWDNERERHKLARRTEEGLIYGGQEFPLGE